MASTLGWPEAVVLDLDGTLVDSAEDIAAALNTGLAESGLAPHPVAAVQRMIGGGIKKLVERALEARGGSVDASLAAAITERVLDHYRAAPARATRIYPGGRELLDGLRAEGRRLGICTNKPTDLALAILGALGVRGHFGAVVGGSDTLAKKPDPAMLHATLAELGVGAARAVMIGDSHADVGAARAAGLPVVLVSYGYTATPAHALGGDVVIDALSQVPGALTRLAEGR